MAERVKLKHKDKRHGYFSKGGKAGPGRPKGAPNVHSRILREAVVMAAEQIGRDGKGLDGLVGYLKRLAIAKDPYLFVGLLGRTLPMQVLTPADQTLRVELSLPQLQQRLAERGLPISGVFKSPIGTLSPPKVINGSTNGSSHGGNGRAE